MTRPRTVGDPCHHLEIGNNSGGETIHITDTEVRDQVEDLAKNADLSKFIL